MTQSPTWESKSVLRTLYFSSLILINPTGCVIFKGVIY